MLYGMTGLALSVLVVQSSVGDVRV
jgi:hypothetical protein